MLTKKSVRLLQVPSIQRCYCCGELRFAIASQALVHKPSGKTHFRWLCKSCGHQRGIRPTPGYLRKLRGLERGNELTVDFQVLLRA